MNKTNNIKDNNKNNNDKNDKDEDDNGHKEDREDHKDKHVREEEDDDYVFFVRSLCLWGPCQLRTHNCINCVQHSDVRKIIKNMAGK